MNSSEKSYAHNHMSPGYGKIYNRVYDGGYYGSLWTQIERPLVTQILEEHCYSRESCLDFACGTGRITALACEFFEHVEGVDISQDMLSVNSCKKFVKLHCEDIRHSYLGKNYDVVLAFRFFLNAEHNLRSDILRSIHRHMNDGGKLVCNIHMLETSPMGRLYRVLNSIFGARFHKTLSISYFSQLLADQGFQIEDLYFYGYMGRPGPLFPNFVAMLVPYIERIAQKFNWSEDLAHSCIIVARRIRK